MSETATEGAAPPKNGTSNIPATVPQRTPSLPVHKSGIELSTLDDIWRFSGFITVSGWAPKGMNREACVVAIQMGLELGMSPMMALQNMAVINGRPGVYGDAVSAIVEASGLLEDFDEWFELEGQRVDRLTSFPDDAAAVCMSKRKGRRPRTTVYTVGDAKLAKLWQKKGNNGQDTPWITNPARMLRFRAMHFNLRGNFSDVLKGFRSAEELRDETEILGEVIDVKPNTPPIGRVSLSSPAPADPQEGKPVGQTPDDDAGGDSDQQTEASPTTTEQTTNPAEASKTEPTTKQEPTTPEQADAGALADQISDLEDKVMACKTKADFAAINELLGKAKAEIGGQNYMKLLELSGKQYQANVPADPAPANKQTNNGGKRRMF